MNYYDPADGRPPLRPSLLTTALVCAGIGALATYILYHLLIPIIIPLFR